MSDRPVLTRALRYGAGALALLAYGQANYVVGFDSGTDASLCVFNDMMFHERHAACGRVWVNSPAMVATRAWRMVSGDALPGTRLIEGK